MVQSHKLAERPTQSGKISLSSGLTITYTFTSNPDGGPSVNELRQFHDVVGKAQGIFTVSARRGVEPDELLDAVVEALRPPVGDPTALTAGEFETLSSIGVAVPSAEDAARLAASQMTQNAADYTRLLANSWGVVEFSEHLGVGPSRVRQRLNHDLTLWGFKVGPRHEWRIPAWEVTEDGALPGIETLSPSIPSELHPIAVERLVTLPNPDLRIDGSSVSVVDWLQAGRDPQDAVDAIGRPADLV